MVEQLKLKLPLYTDLSSTDAGIVILELLAGGLDIISYYVDIIANELFIPTAKDRENVLKLINPFGYTPRTSSPSQFNQVFEITPLEVDYIIPKGFIVKTGTMTTDSTILYFETDSELKIPAGETGLEKNLDGSYKYMTTVTQGISVKNDYIGTSLSTPNQTFKLSYPKAHLDSIDLYVNSGFGFEKWNRVDSFINSSPTSKHYVVRFTNNDEAIIAFGSGECGAIPPKVQNGIFANYRITDGALGNVQEESIYDYDFKDGIIVSTIDVGIITYGVDKETIDELKNNAVAFLRTKNRAVTKQDFIDLALLQSNVLSANAVYDSETNIVTIYILPIDIDTVSVAQDASLTAYFDEVTVLGTNFEIDSAVKEVVNIAVDVIVEPNFVNATMKANIETLITNYFAKGNFVLGQSFYKSALMKEISLLEGVLSINITSPVANVDLSSEPSKYISLGTNVATVTGGV